MIARFTILVLVMVTLRAAEAPLPIQAPPIPPSPVEDFRRWLQLSPAGQEKELAAYPEAKREVLRRKLGSYQAMPPAQREARLRTLELRWYLPVLMTVSAAQRANYLEVVPPRLHDPIRARLSHWDSLDEDTRREILADPKKREMITRYFVLSRRTQVPPPPFPVDAGTHLGGLREHFAHWDSKSSAARQRISTHLSNFFELPRKDQLKALNELSESERREMQKTLDAFARLSPADRRACVDSFQRLAAMSPQERASFLRNANRWRQLSSEERATWRELVSKVPPMPPEPVPAPPVPSASTTADFSRQFADTVEPKETNPAPLGLN